jgi:hypothetical protein
VALVCPILALFGANSSRMFCHGLLSAEVQFLSRRFQRWLGLALSANTGQVAPLEQQALRV